ncbi:MAG: lamin tail domain-containing protein [Paludibacteraceae bacterium]|nr:lamin tail domain-containing protein [Paludibacteraceae bacterium]
MKKILFVWAFLCPFCAFAQLNVSFADGVIPSYCVGTDSLFSVADGVVTSSNNVAGESYLFAPSVAMDDAEWGLTVTMTQPTGSCFARYYLAVDAPAIDGSSSGYFLRLGDSKRQVSLCFRKESGSVVTLAKGDTMRLLPPPNEKMLRVEVKVTRSSAGEWVVYSRLNDEESFRQELSVTDNTLTQASYSGIYCKYPKSKANTFSFSGWTVEGEPAFVPDPPSLPEPNDLIFTEIMFAPSADGAEFVEIYNRSDKVIDLSGLSLAARKKDGAVSYGKRIASSSSLIYPDEYKVVTKYPEKVGDLSSCASDGAMVQMSNMAALNNAGGWVSLFRTSDSLLIDEAYFASDLHVEGVPDKGVGVSLERVSIEGSSWTSASPATGYASPGCENQAMMAVEDILFEADPLCAPYLEASGFWHLRYNLDKPGYLANVRVYALNGAVVRTLGHSLPLSVSGELVWDGRTDGGALVAVAPYIVVVQAIHPSGDMVNRRFVVTVSR